jgi:FkbH-like protein
MANLEQAPPALIVAATFTAEPLSPYLKLLLHEAGLTLHVRFAPYNQVLQELLSPHSSLAANLCGIDVVLLRLEDYGRGVPELPKAVKLIRRSADELGNALIQHARRVNIPTIVGVMPPALTGALGTEILEAIAELILRLAMEPAITLLSAVEIESLSAFESRDELTDELAHIPFREEQYASMAIGIARKIHALRVPARKVLVLDCDETLWRGVVGEDGVEGLRISPGLARLQRFAVEKQAEGALVCLVSKNNERDVLEVFEQRSDMILTMDRVVAHRINWESKPSNLASLARELDLGLDAFVFIDDSPVECGRMRAELPQVITLQLPPEDKIEHFLANLWTFDKLTVTAEDARRTAMYRENVARLRLRESAADIAEFIRSLDLIVEIDPPSSDDWARVAQLTQRTNQFNFTAARYNEAEIRALPKSGYRVLCVKVRDRFGDYGLVGAVIMHEVPSALAVDNMLLSCRVLGRGVEHAIVRHLGEFAKKRNLGRVELGYVATGKNQPARAFAESIAKHCRIEQASGAIYGIPTEVACELAYGPAIDTTLAGESGKTAAIPSIRPVTIASGSERYARLAGALNSGSGVIDAVRGIGFRSRSLPSHATRPASDTERELALLWRELLNVEDLGVEDDYFALGGTSLLAVRLIAEISRRFGIKLALTSVVEAPTVRALSRLIEHPSAPRDSLIELKGAGTRNLFLVHDGDGETLLYLNLANRVPEDVAVFGLAPHVLPGVPLAHSTIEEMAAAYVEQIRGKQPDGPYFLGGMCAGGVIAYEMASQLVRMGEAVELVALFDAARPGALRKPGRVARERLGRLQQALADRSGGSRVKRVESFVGTLARKGFAWIRWEITRNGMSLFTRVRFALLSAILKSGRQWPKFIPPLNVREIYDSAEARYTPARLALPRVVLARATNGYADDTPYREIYVEEGLGWEAIASQLKIVDVEGGHSSMLREQFADSLAQALMPYLPAKAEPMRAAR